MVRTAKHFEYSSCFNVLPIALQVMGMYLHAVVLIGASYTQTINFKDPVKNTLIGNFHKYFIFAKTELSPRQMAQLLCRLLI